VDRVLGGRGITIVAIDLLVLGDMLFVDEDETADLESIRQLFERFDPGGVLGWAFRRGYNHALERLRGTHEAFARRDGEETGLEARVQHALAELPPALGAVLRFDLEHGGLGSPELAARAGLPDAPFVRRHARAALGTRLDPLVPAQEHWYRLVRRLGRGPDLRRLEPVESWAEFQQASERARTEVRPEPLPAEGPGGEATESMRTRFLLERARARDGRAWEEFYRRYRTMLVVKIQSRMRHYRSRPFQAEEILQDSFVRAWTNLDRFHYEGEGSFRRWLATVVLNEFRNRMKAHRRLNARMASEEGHTERAIAADETRERYAAVLEAMARLMPLERDVVTMRIHEQLSWAEVQEVLDCSQASAQALFQRAMDKLRERLG